MSNMYQTEAKEPRIDWKYPGVQACTPCIFLHFSFFLKRLSFAYQLSKLSKWTCYVQNVPNRSQRTSNWLKISWRTSSYAVHISKNSIFLKRLSCVYQLSKLLKWTCYVQNVPNRSQRTPNWLKISWRTSSYAVHFFLHFSLFFKTTFLCLSTV